jgi:hypothetical protein
MTTTHSAAIFTTGGLTLLHGNKVHSVGTEHPRFEAIKAHIANQEYEQAVGLIDLPAMVSNYFDPAKYPDFLFTGGLITVRGYTFPPEVTEKVLRMVDAGAPAQPLVNFLTKVLENPSASARRELLLFCVANNFLIHEDGDIIAYKGVRDDYYDHHSGSVLNKPFALMTVEELTYLPRRVGTVTVTAIDGHTVVSMPRAEVDDRRDQTCSFGLHIASYEYAVTYGPRLLVVKVNPAHVVSIPSDYNNQKGRCCAYTILTEIVREERPTNREVYSDQDFGYDEEAECVEADEEVEVPTFSDRDRVTEAVLDALSEVGVVETIAEYDQRTFDTLDVTRSDRERLSLYVDDALGICSPIPSADQTVADYISALIVAL